MHLNPGVFCTVVLQQCPLDRVGITFKAMQINNIHELPTKNPFIIRIYTAKFFKKKDDKSCGSLKGQHQMPSLTPLHETYCRWDRTPPSQADVLEGLAQLVTTRFNDVIQELIKSIQREILMSIFGLS